MANAVNILKNFKVRTRIQVIVALPLLVAVVLAGQALLEKNAVLDRSTKLQHLVELAETSSALVHEMQKERGLSAGFIGSKGKTFSAELPAQRADTDKKATKLVDTLATFTPESFGEGLQAKVTDARNALKGLAEIREGVAAFKVSVPEMAKYYTTTIARLLSISEEMQGLSKDAVVLSRISAYTAFLQGKERAGIERAMGAGGFGAGKFAPPVYQKFLKMIAQQETYFSRFALNTGAV